MGGSDYCIRPDCAGLRRIAWCPVSRLWKRSAEVRGGGGGDVVRRMGTQQQTTVRAVHSCNSWFRFDCVYTFATTYGPLD